MRTSLANVIIPLLIIFLIGLVGIFHHEPLHVFRDIAYALTPIALLITGYWIAENSKMRITFFRILLLGGFIIAAVHIFKFILDPKLLTQDIASMRLYAMNPNVDLVSIALTIGLFRKKLRLDSLFPRLLPWYVVIPILIISFVLSFSRTGLVMLFVMTVAITGLIGKLTIKSILVFLIFVITFSVIILTTPRDDVKTFRGKIARSVREVVAKEYTDYRDITINWRGHETWKALETFRSGNVRQKIVGHGFGALVDLDMTMILAGEEFTEIPILHNGYAYILVKTGIIGIICYLLYYIILLYRSRPSVNRNVQERIMLSRLLLGSTITLILTMFVIGGMAEIHESEFVLLTGFLLNRMEQTET
jgi:O-antigen ligase